MNWHAIATGSTRPPWPTPSAKPSASERGCCGMDHQGQDNRVRSFRQPAVKGFAKPGDGDRAA